MTVPTVDAALARSFARDGVVCVRGALDPDEVALAAEAIEARAGAAEPARAGRQRRRRPRPVLRGLLPVDRGRRDRAARPRLPGAGDRGRLLATPQVRLYHDHVLVKEGGTAQRTPWHQDQPYYNVDGRGVSAWIPVDPVPEAGSLELLAGSHAGPWLMPRTFLSGEAKWFPEGSLAELPDIEADRDAFDLRQLRAPAGRRRLLRLPHRARRARLPVRRTPSGALAAVPLRGGPARAAALAHVAAVRGAGRRAAGRRRDGLIRCSRWSGRADAVSDRSAAGWTSSTRTPPASFGCTKLTRLSAVPRLGIVVEQAEARARAGSR